MTFICIQHCCSQAAGAPPSVSGIVLGLDKKSDGRANRAYLDPQWANNTQVAKRLPRTNSNRPDNFTSLQSYHLVRQNPGLFKRYRRKLFIALGLRSCDSAFYLPSTPKKNLSCVCSLFCKTPDLGDIPKARPIK